jgi:hypothetical protein
MVRPVGATVAAASASSAGSYPSAASYPASSNSSHNAALLTAINKLSVAFANHQHDIYMDTNKVGHTMVQTMKQRKGIR